MSGQGSPEGLDLIRSKRHDDRPNLRAFVKSPQRMNEDRRARDLDKLFWSLTAESASTAGGGNDGDVHMGWLVVGGQLLVVGG